MMDLLYDCPLCGTREWSVSDATRGYAFKLHLQFTHNFEIPQDGYDYPTIYRCPACGERFVKPDELTKHFEDLERAGKLAVHCIPAAAKALFGRKP